MEFWPKFQELLDAGGQFVVICGGQVTFSNTSTEWADLFWREVICLVGYVP